MGSNQGPYRMGYPPSANRYWRVWRGRAVMSSEARAYKKTEAERLRAHGATMLEGPVGVAMVMRRPRKSGDLDNFQKVVLDACNGVLWEDDSQIIRLEATRMDDRENPGVTIWAWDASWIGSGG